jgi:hypothetical protein
LPPGTQGQARPPAGTAVVRGRVIQTETAAPIPGARVTLTVSPAESSTVLTDDDGRYEIENVSRGGSYTMTVSKSRLRRGDASVFTEFRLATTT